MSMSSVVSIDPCLHLMQTRFPLGYSVLSKTTQFVQTISGSMQARGLPSTHDPEVLDPHGWYLNKLVSWHSLIPASGIEHVTFHQHLSPLRQRSSAVPRCNDFMIPGFQRLDITWSGFRSQIISVAGCAAAGSAAAGCAATICTAACLAAFAAGSCSQNVLGIGRQ